jgi:hypothetical protein
VGLLPRFLCKNKTKLSSKIVLIPDETDNNAGNFQHGKTTVPHQFGYCGGWPMMRFYLLEYARKAVVELTRLKTPSP